MSPTAGSTLATTLWRAAALITLLTVLARLAGFVRNLVFARTVGFTCLADTYTTVNTLPNIVFEVVAGGALASLVVPLLARATDVDDADRVAATSSALLTWAVLILTPVAVVVAVAAVPLSTALLGAKDCAGAVDVGASMLRVFAPQIVLYGLGIVLTGILHAHRRFAGPALAPLLSSLVVIASYLLFSAMTPRGTDVATLTTGPELVLSIGTTLGVAVLALSLLLPLRRTGVRLRPRLRFPSGVAAQVRRFAYAGVAVLSAQQLSVLVALLLGNADGVPGATVAVFWQAQTLFLLPWALLAVPVATAVYPLLAQRWAAGDAHGYRHELATTTRATVALGLAATAVLLAAAWPLAEMVALAAPGRPSVAPLAAAITAFAFGLAGYSLFALLSRALYASGETRRTAYACVGGWAVAIIATFLLASALPEQQRAVALGAGNSVGMSALGALLLAAVAARAGRAALAGVGRTALAAALAAAAAAVLGRAVADWLPGETPWAAAVAAVVVGAVTLTAFVAVIALVARDVLTGATGALAERLRGARNA